MSFSAKAAHCLRAAARYVQDPSQLAMRRPYFIPGLYGALSKPWVRALNIVTILDVGANVGDFAFTVRPIFPLAHIFSFEPLPDSYDAMLRNLAGARRFTALNLALGDQSGELTFQRSAFAPSSSFLTMAPAHREAFPETSASQPVTVRVEPLDEVIRQLDAPDPLLVKIDVQGYEAHVLCGGERTIRRARLLIIETSFEPLYAGQALFGDVHQALRGWGFRYAGSVGSLPHPKDGRPLQEDSLFLRDEPAAGTS